MTDRFGPAARLCALAMATVALAGCASKFKTYDGPQVTQIYVAKSARQMYLMHDRAVLATYKVDLGRTPLGHKAVEGDGRTPEGAYFIDRRNPNSSYWLSLGISYPNPGDRAQAAALGVSPGGDVFIHGQGRKKRGPDWTWGCISVKDKEMETIYAMVRDGTPIYIAP